MAFIGPADVTVTLNPEDIDRSPDGRIGMRTFPTVAFGNGILQYSTLGIPMPAIGKFGFHFAIKRAYIEQPGNGFIYSFDRANHKLRIFLGAAQAAITANFTGDAKTTALSGDAKTTALSGDARTVALTMSALANITPTGNVANGRFTGDANTLGFTGDAATPSGNVANTAAVSAGTPTGNVANLSFTGDLIDDAGVNYTPTGNIANAATDFVGDAMPTHTHGAQNFTGDTKTPTGNIAAYTPTGNISAGNFTGNPISPGTPAGNVTITPTGNITATPTGNVTATPTGNVAITGGAAVAEAALAEMDSGVAPAATTLYMEMVGR